MPEDVTEPRLGACTEPRPEASTETSEDISRVEAEIIEEVRERRKSDPSLVAQEQQIHEVWADSIPSRAAASPAAIAARSPQEQLDHLLSCVRELSLIKVAAPVGKRLGVKQIRRIVQRLTRWQLRYLADQINGFNHYLVGLLNSIEQRVAQLEYNLQATQLVRPLLDPVPDADEALALAVADSLSGVDSPVAVVSCGAGQIVAALTKSEITAHGVDESAEAVADGIKSGLDLRMAEPLQHLSGLAAGSLGAVVLSKSIEHCGFAELLAILDQSLRCLSSSGIIVVAVADADTRSVAESELLQASGLSPQTWAHLLRKRGCVVESRELSTARVKTLLKARRQPTKQQVDS